MARLKQKAGSITRSKRDFDLTQKHANQILMKNKKSSAYQYNVPNQISMLLITSQGRKQFFYMVFFTVIQSFLVVQNFLHPYYFKKQSYQLFFAQKAAIIFTGKNKMTVKIDNAVSVSYYSFQLFPILSFTVSQFHARSVLKLGLPLYLKRQVKIQI